MTATPPPPAAYPPPQPPQRRHGPLFGAACCAALFVAAVAAVAVLGSTGPDPAVPVPAAPPTSASREATTTTAAMSDVARRMACDADAFYCGMSDANWDEFVSLSCDVIDVIYDEFGAGISDDEFSEVAVVAMYNVGMTQREVDQAVVVIGLVWGARESLC